MKTLSLLLASVLSISACSLINPKADLEPLEEIRPGLLKGYLSAEALPDLIGLLPPPPQEGSARHALDKESSAAGLALQGTARWELAKQDAALTFPAAAQTFACALNAPISEQDTPHIYRMLRRILADAGYSTYAVKHHYGRKRPFQENNQATCTPEAESYLAKNASYPSGHSALGWASALMLSQVAPERTDALMARGRAFSQSRVICNVHWQSDVDEGREAGLATFLHLQGNADYLANLAAAREEYLAVKGQKIPKDCEAESAALAM